MEIQNAEAAYINVTDCLLEKKYELLDTIEINNGRYKILKTNKETFLVVFKREGFRNFGKYFRDQGQTGMGETLNLEDLKSAVLKGARSVIFIYPNRHIYKLSVEEILNNGFRRTTKEGKQTISFSIHLLNRLNPDEEGFEWNFQ